ncbi:lipase family protein [uncultured Corynebacterium sp.]|uniref:lipase family protein n=1 Tax=uncultured Corynebacterium sp. TaxID=159447 RepID=UPI00259A8F83|nr:lipase family protein [uncultured Corynebacterium sp.]
MFSSARPAYHAPARTLRRRVAASLCASSLLAAGITAIGTPVATAQSSQAFGSIADITPESAVQLGTSPKPLPPHANPTVDSGLPVAAPTADQLTPGTVHAEVPLDPSVGLPAAATQQRFAYTTIDQHGQAATSTAAIFLPEGPAPEGGFPVLAWAHGTTGLGTQCAPSINPRSERDSQYLSHWLNQGYAIVASDYAGLGSPGLHSYLNGKVTGANVIDSVIAAQNLPEGAQLSNQWSVIGQSQGGGAALHVALQATERSQAAGLDFRGTVATGAPAYIEEIVLAGGPTFPPVPLPEGLTVYALYILGAFREARPDIDIDSVLTDEGKQMVATAEQSCYGQLAQSMDGVNLARAFNKPLRSLPGLEQALRDYMQTPTRGYDRPVFLGHGITDIDVPSPIGIILNSEMWLNQFVGDNRNNRVEVHWYPTDHRGTVMRSTTDSTPFMRSLFV